MVHAAEVLRGVRDIKMSSRTSPLPRPTNPHSILGANADWKSEPGSLSEIAHFAELIARSRVGFLSRVSVLRRARQAGRSFAGPAGPALTHAQRTAFELA